MSFTCNKEEIQHRALLEAARFCGGIAALGRDIEVERKRADNWTNKGVRIPYQYALLIEEITHVSIERLSPFTKTANKVIKRLRALENPSAMKLEINQIMMGEHSYLKWQQPERPIIVGTDGVLISGLMQIENYKKSGIKKAEAIVLDVEAILLGKRFIQDIQFDFLVSERVSIGLRLERLLGNRQGHRNDLNNVGKNLEGNIKNSLQLRPPGDKVGRVDIYIAELIGLNSKTTYRRARRVCLEGEPDLISAMDCKKISIKVADEKIMNAKRFQQNKVQTNVQEGCVS